MSHVTLVCDDDKLIQAHKVEHVFRLEEIYNLTLFCKYPIYRKDGTGKYGPKYRKGELSGKVPGASRKRSECLTKYCIS